MFNIRWRYLAPIVLVALCLITLGIVTALSLFREQASVTKVLKENVESRRAAVELEECLTDLIALEKDRVETVSVLHHRVVLLLDNMKQLSDNPEEFRMHTEITVAFQKYLTLWQQMPSLPQVRHETARREATGVLETESLKPCQDFRLYNARRIEISVETHERILKQLAWGMAVIGSLGGIAGLILGYGVARGLARTIRRLSVQIRDAAGKLDPASPEIVVTGDGNFSGLHADIDTLTLRIETMVQKLQQREHEIQRAKQLAAVGQLAAGVAHELRNPLTSIKLLVQTGLEGEGSHLTVEDLTIIDDEIRRMEQSLQTFLDFARPPKLDRREMTVAPILESVTNLLRRRAERMNVRIVLADQAVSRTVLVDAVQLRQVLLNLLLNAIDAMPTGGTVTLTTHVHASVLDLEISDTGPGIAEAIQSRLFEPFASTKDTGLGLGLVISKRIVEEHGGTLRTVYREGAGATFVVTLPIC
ncbi:hypothetical protein BH11PLA2_BH11PLA2_25130 [soil metagenome]